MKKNGFTLIEILAVIIIMGIVGIIGISAVSNNISDSREASFVNLARNFTESARSMRGQDKLPHDPKNGEVLLLKLEALNGVDEIKDYDTPYGELILDYCYVMIVNNNNNFKYYITLLDDSDHAIYYEEYSTLSNDSVLSSSNANVKKILSFNSLTRNTVLTIDGTKYKVSNVYEKYLVLKK